MLPFFGEARFVFVTDPSAAPLAPSMLEALLDTCSRRLQIQERLTQELVSAAHAVTGASGTSGRLYRWCAGKCVRIMVHCDLEHAYGLQTRLVA